MEVSKHFPEKKRAELDRYWDKVEKLYNMAVELCSVNLLNYVPGDATLQHKRNYLFTSKPKEIWFSKGNASFTFFYNRDGSAQYFNFDSNVVPEIIGNDLFDGFSIRGLDVYLKIKDLDYLDTSVGFKISLTQGEGGLILDDINYGDIDLFNYI